MNQHAHKRSLKHIRETIHLHWHYMGLGFLLSLCFVVGVSVTLAVIFQLQSDLIWTLEEDIAEEMIRNQTFLLRLYIAQVVLFLIALAALMVLTSHRIAGPYLALKRTFLAIRNGRKETRLKFRAYDRLDDVADAFNEMMDTLEAASDPGTNPGAGKEVQE